MGGIKRGIDVAETSDARTRPSVAGNGSSDNIASTAENTAAKDDGTKQPPKVYYSLFTKNSRPKTMRPTVVGKFTESSISTRKIFCDLDGVLVDFDAGVERLRRHRQEKQSNNSNNNHNNNPTAPRPFHMWPAIYSTPHFYRDLPWTVDGKELWEALRPLSPIILTGVPNGTGGIGADKVAWCQRELLPSSSSNNTDGDNSNDNNMDATVRGRDYLGRVHWRDMAAPRKTHARVPRLQPTAKSDPTPLSNDKTTTATATSSTTSTTTNGTTQQQQQQQHQQLTVITCWSVHKHCECRRPGDVLIDDRPEVLRDAWERAGGIFIHHTHTAHTLQQLYTLGILLPTTTTTTDGCAAATTIVESSSHDPANVDRDMDGIATATNTTPTNLKGNAVNEKANHNASIPPTPPQTTTISGTASTVSSEAMNDIGTHSTRVNNDRNVPAGSDMKTPTKYTDHTTEKTKRYITSSVTSTTSSSTVAVSEATTPVHPNHDSTISSPN